MDPAEPPVGVQLVSITLELARSSNCGPSTSYNAARVAPPPSRTDLQVKVG